MSKSSGTKGDTAADTQSGSHSALSEAEQLAAGKSKDREKIVSAYANPYYRYLVLGILTTVYISNFVDRQVINVLAAYIIEDLQLSDGQFGMLSGLAFAFIYTVLGIPIARLADLSNRRNVIAISVGIWSLMTAACGFAQNFGQLFLAFFLLFEDILVSEMVVSQLLLLLELDLLFHLIDVEHISLCIYRMN